MTVFGFFADVLRALYGMIVEQLLRKRSPK